MKHFDGISGGHVALDEHPQIEAGAALGDQPRGHLRIVDANADAVTRDARLRHLERRRADPNRSPMHTSSSGNPSTVKFSPN